MFYIAKLRPCNNTEYPNIQTTTYEQTLGDSGKEKHAFNRKKTLTQPGPGNGAHDLPPVGGEGRNTKYEHVWIKQNDTVVATKANSKLHKSTSQWVASSQILNNQGALKVSGEITDIFIVSSDNSVCVCVCYCVGPTENVAFFSYFKTSEFYYKLKNQH